MSHNILVRDNLKEVYNDVYPPEVLSALSSLAPLNKTIKEAMALRIKRREERVQSKTRITFPGADGYIHKNKNRGCA
jgi:malate synthase